MYEQFLIYWFSWIIFIIIVFFMNRSTFRSFLIIWVLLVLITFPIFVMIKNVQISICLVLLISGAIIFYVREKVTIYRLIVTFTIFIGYTGILFWKNITPVWFFMPSFIIISILIVSLMIVLLKQLHEQISVVLLGVLFGHVFYDLLLIDYSLHNQIGNNAYLVICLTILILICIHTMKNIYKKCIFLLQGWIS